MKAINKQYNNNIKNIFGCFILITLCCTLQSSWHIAENNNNPTSEPDITFPGPDTANFPLSPFCLPKGRVYWENFPLNFYVFPDHSSYQYYWPYLLRFGLTDNVELRFSGDGLTAIDTHNAHGIGLSPVEIGFKVHIWGTPDIRWIPSIGLETALITKLASKQFRDNTQCRILAIFFHSFSPKLSLEWNIGTYSTSFTNRTKRTFIALVEWALQTDLHKRLGFFFEGHYNSGNQMFLPAVLLLGAGFISNLTKRICIYGSYNWPLLKKNAELVNVGFAAAF